MRSKIGPTDRDQPARAESDQPTPVAQRRVAPGKRSMGTASSSVRTAVVQRSPAASVATRSTRARADTDRWMATVMRPDLHGAPTQDRSAADATPTGSGQSVPSTGSGRPMPDAVQAKMERCFGADFSAVRIHEGPHADAIGALAYTQGTDLHFAPGQYQPDSQKGQELLGHELTHVVQQSQGRVPVTGQAKGVDINSDSGLEREADELGARAARGLPATTSGVDESASAAFAQTPVGQRASVDTPVQRYTVENGYALGSTMANELMFQQQGIQHRSGTHYRINKEVRAGTLVAEREEYDPGTHNWAVVDTENLDANPPLRVTEHGRIAIEDSGGQAKLMYIEPGLLDEVNDKLFQTAPVLLQKGTASITLPAGMAGLAANLTLYQASARAKDDAEDQVARFQDMETEALQLQVECHNIAQQLGNLVPMAGENPDVGAGADAAASPEIGQKYYYHAPANAATDTTMPFERPGALARFFGTPDPAHTFHSVVDELAVIDQRIAQVDHDFSMVQALTAMPGGVSDEAKAQLPGWGDHSETVVAKDGADTVTMVNYNRRTESNWVITRVIREMYRNFVAFRTRFKQLYEQKLPDQNGELDAVLITFLASQFPTDIAALMADLDAASGQALLRARSSATELGARAWYFDMYGPLGQSFHDQYNVLAARGLGAGQTSVHGTATDDAPLMGADMFGVMDAEED